jgi:hypothetical protein
MPMSVCRGCGRLLPKSSTSATVNTVSDGTKRDATIRRNVRFEFDENPESNPDRHCKKDYEINRESEPERIQQPTIPSETETNGKPMKNIKCDREWTEVHYKRTRKNRTESQGRKKTGAGLMGQKGTWRKELV